MLLIPCPNCGERDEGEFNYGGSARVFPPVEKMTSVEDWHRSIHFASHEQGQVHEYWYHHGGCECWIEVKRNLHNHEIAPVKATRSDTDRAGT